MKKISLLLCIVLLCGALTAQALAAPTAAPAASPENTQAPAETPAPEQSAEPEVSPAPAETYATNIQYDNYEVWDGNYYVALEKTTIYADMSTSSKAIGSLAFGKRIKRDEATQEKDGVTWAKVYLDDGSAGYVNTAQGGARSFRAQRAFQELLFIQDHLNSPFVVRMSNYRNANGMPPVLADGKTTDAYENRRETGSPCYANPDNSVPPVRYAPDGLLGLQYEQYNGYTRVYFPSFDAYYWIPDRYVSTKAAVTDLKQVIAVDRANQNLCMFEKNDAGQWELIAMNYVTTGKAGGKSLKTPLGHFAALDKKHYFYFDNEGDNIVDGYALWAIRFSAGGYTHGVPASSKQQEDGSVYVGGSAEGQSTLGTVPKSHMCVRNYTSFAKFMYDRAIIGGCSVIVFE
ncbi:MAG: L,D-transpeptidase family protein [Eubacteriales bacterium]|nr:L,D-transpeptidase family protein [Eubacteriales bacterium]